MKSQSVCEKDFIYVLDNDDKIHGIRELLYMYILHIAILVFFCFVHLYEIWDMGHRDNGLQLINNNLLLLCFISSLSLFSHMYVCVFVYIYIYTAYI